MDISIANVKSTAEPDFHTLMVLDDFAGHEMVQSTLFKVEVIMPAVPCAHCILRTRYVSHNPLEVDPKNNTESVFYNCADIELIAPSSPAKAPAALRVKPPVQVASTYTCKTPDRFKASLVETNAWGTVEHTVWWDAPSHLTRWDKNGSLDGSGSKTKLSLINNYTAPVEYVNFISRGQCHIYGNDHWYDFSFGGTATGMLHIGRTTSGIDSWQDARGHYTWLTRDLGNGVCSPIGWRRGESAVDVVEFVPLSHIAPATFTPDASCLKHPTFRGCRAEAVKAQWASGSLDALANSTPDDGPSLDPPVVPLPYTTTMLRTHHFAAAEFLSIAEELSVQAVPGSAGGNFEEAYYIFPAVPFSMRDANETVVRGIRAVFQHTSDSLASYKETWYFLTGLDGVERCAHHSLVNVTVSTPTFKEATTLRGGIEVKGWAEPIGLGGSTTTYYAQEKRDDAVASGAGKVVSYPFRIDVVHPPGGGEIGYVLDHGQHFPVAVGKWFVKEPSCPKATVTMSAAPRHGDASRHANPYMELSQLMN